jgi:hypothetical protein
MIECPGNGDIGECECDGQLWINENCRSVVKILEQLFKKALDQLIFILERVSTASPSLLAAEGTSVVLRVKGLTSTWLTSPGHASRYDI